MDRFLRPKRKADAILLSEELAGASQPSESRPDTRPCESEAGNSTADHAPSGNVPKVTKRSALLTVNANIEVMSCSSDTEVDEFEIPDQDQTARYEETLEKIKLTDPEAVQWLRDDIHIDEAARLRATHLRNQARQIIMFSSSLNTKKFQRSGKAKVLGLAKFMMEHTVQENNKALEAKARKVLRSCHKAATRHASNFDSMLVDLAAMKETNVESNDFFNIGLLLIDPTSNYPSKEP